MKRRIWRFIGFCAYWVLMPLIRIYANNTKPRARVLIVHNTEALVVKNWLGGGGWALPGGGINAGEQAMEAAIREISEELDIKLEPAAIVALGEHVAWERGGLKSPYFLFAVQLTEKPKLKPNTTEIVEVSWLEMTDLATAKTGVSSTVKQSIEVWLNRGNLLS